MKKTIEKIATVASDMEAVQTKTISALVADIGEKLFNTLTYQRIEINNCAPRNKGARIIVNMTAMQSCFEENRRWPSVMEVDSTFDCHSWQHSEYPSEREYQASLILLTRPSSIAELNSAIRKFLLAELDKKQQEFRALLEP